MPEPSSRAILCLSPMVPLVPMSHPMSPLTCCGTAMHIQDLRHCMDVVEDGFSQSESEESSSGKEEAKSVSQRSKATHVHHVPSKQFIRDHYKDGTLPSNKDNHKRYSTNSRPASFSSRQSSREESQTNASTVDEKSSKTPSRQVSRDEQHSLTSQKSVTTNEHTAKVGMVHRQVSRDERTASNSTITNEQTAKQMDDHHGRRGRIAHALAFKYLDGGHDRKCQFGKLKIDDIHKALSFEKEKSYQSAACICESVQPSDDSLGGWGVVDRPQKFKNAKRSRKSFSKVSSESAFNRLIGFTERDEFEFEHHHDTRRYIEQYRFQHTVGDVCRRAFDVKPTIVRRNVESDPYYSRFRNTICAIASNCDILAILGGDKDSQSTSSSETGPNSRSRSDEETDDPRNMSVKDRGKTLNLAPVRECMGTDLAGTESKEQMKQTYLTLNQYLNLVIPPKSGLTNNFLQSDSEDIKDRRYRVQTAGDNHLFPACNPRRGARPLRLGSAEFVKPGTPEQFGPPEARWSSSGEKKNNGGADRKLQKATSFHASTVPGNLYVGSTVSRESFSASNSSARSPSGGQQQKKPLTPKPKTPPNHSISGKQVKPCERVGDLGAARSRTSAREDAHAPPSSAPLPSRSHTASEIRDHCARRQEKILSVNVAHLGVRGRTFKPEEHLTIIYKFNKDKTRRIAVNSSLKS